MAIRLTSAHRRVEIFTISPRTTDPTQYWSNILRVCEWSEALGCTGVLIFTGNDTYVDPWLVAQHVCATTSLSPLVAVNPVYMHPFSAAKMISSLAYVYGRRVYLNVVAGTALSHQRALGDHLEHGERYERASEYIAIVRSLLSDSGRVCFRGKYYTVDGLQLIPAFPAALSPGIVLAGQSAAAREFAVSTGGTWMKMLPPSLDIDDDGATGVHFGIITRPTAVAAWDAARALFPADPEGRAMLAMSVLNTDAEWKRRLAAAGDGNHAQGYWLEPFLNFRADCPYFVGDYDATAALLRRLSQSGMQVLILDVPADAAEFVHLGEAFDRATYDTASNIADTGDYRR